MPIRSPFRAKAENARTMGHHPRIAFASFSNFGSREIERIDRIRKAIRLLDAEKVDFDAGARGLPKMNMVAFDLKGGSRVIARPSGTEPKAKFYFDVCEPIEEREELSLARARAERSMADLARAFQALF